MNVKSLWPALALTLAAGAAQAQDVAYTLYNNSPLTVMEFYASPSDVGSWEEDILGANVLPPGQAGTVTIADGRSQCVYDLMFVFEDGQTLTDSVDICTLESYTLQ